ncbi:MAG TPA: hypothetical protein PK239_18340 [Chitinophagales bacterium]|nr:hypothetical protein [Chitinophagales bacterium]HRK29241.1 hypothetical protein [Chitinophagales bacterium]
MQQTILAVLFLLCANLAAQTTMSIARLQQNIDKAKQQATKLG